uniref:Calcineurin-like phosphoesterase domain-containing protein n=1 Tax=Noctiluca scintillans TaxID=2966 RepID=A0A7S0ZVA7_NOCSC|mmetsp:Transcript_20397/g.54605  ORF Transcript_20397/g.54605 Transcript_20397/m.54605 type:complete len:308 (+) Transcript_20397:112-1035(+)
MSDTALDNPGVMSPVEDGQPPKVLRFVIVSDTHNRHDELGTLPDGDVLLHAGDWSTQGTVQEEEEFRTWILALPHRHKVFVNGNHERVMRQSSKEQIRQRFPGCTYLEDDGCEIEGVRLFGSPWCDVGAYFARGSDAAAKWAAIPEDTHVLITHLPPEGVRDLAIEPFVSRSHAPPPPPAEWNVPKEVTAGRPRIDLMSAIRARLPEEVDPTTVRCVLCGKTHRDRQHWGGPELRQRVAILRPVVHVFGHVHEDSGFESHDGTLFLNAASYDHLREGAFIMDLEVSTDAGGAPRVSVVGSPHRQKIC